MRIGYVTELEVHLGIHIVACASATRTHARMCSAHVLHLPSICRCGACKLLKRSFREQGENLVKEAPQFNMVAVNGDDNNDLGVCSPHV